MSKTKYLTFEKARDRYVFQMRIPTALRAYFKNRTAIRIAFGTIPEDTAIQQAKALESKWKLKFHEVKSRNSVVRVAKENNRLITTVLRLTDDIVRRAVATTLVSRTNMLNDKLTLLRAAGDSAWTTELAAAEIIIASVRRRLARGHQSDALCALGALEVEYGLNFRRDGSETEFFVERWNAAEVQFEHAWIEVLRGTRSIKTMMPLRTELLPLVRFFGTPANGLTQRWVDRQGLLGKSPTSKTREKYENIAADAHGIVGEQPVELLTPVNIRDLAALWRNKGNSQTTIADKLGILICLLDAVSKEAADICRSELPRTQLDGVRRHPFSDAQLGALHQHFREARNVHTDDMHLVDMMMLTGARLGELLRLNCDELSRSQSGWIVTIRSREDSRLKNTPSERELPIDTSGLPELHMWLQERISKNGRLFTDARADKHGHYGNAESKRLNRILRKHFPDRRLVLQSIRTTVGQTLRRNGIDPRVRRRALGHADVDIHDKHYDPAELLGAADLESIAPVLAALAVRTRTVPGANEEAKT